MEVNYNEGKIGFWHDNMPLIPIHSAHGGKDVALQFVCTRDFAKSNVYLDMGEYYD